MASVASNKCGDLPTNDRNRQADEKPQQRFDENSWSGLNKLTISERRSVSDSQLKLPAIRISLPALIKYIDGGIRQRASDADSPCAGRRQRGKCDSGNERRRYVDRFPERGNDLPEFAGRLLPGCLQQVGTRVLKCHQSPDAIFKVAATAKQVFGSRGQCERYLQCMSSLRCGLDAFNRQLKSYIADPS